MYLNSFASYSSIIGLKQAPNLCYYVPVALPVCGPVPAASHCSKFLPICPHQYMYLKSCANYFCINMLQTCTKCMLVCASLIAGPLAPANGRSSFFEFLPICPHHACTYILVPIFRHKWASNWHLIYASMCQWHCQSVGRCRWPVIFLNFCLSAHTNTCI